MRAWKFLAAGAVGPFTGFRWPRPGAPGDGWVAAPAGAAEDRWIHACRIEDLPLWLGPELWEVELAGGMAPRRYQVAAPRGRLVRQVTAWDRAASAALAAACRERSRVLAARAPPGPEAAAIVNGYLSTTDRHAEHAPVSAFTTRLLAELVGGEEGREAERAWQARWIAERLAL